MGPTRLSDCVYFHLGAPTRSSQPGIARFVVCQSSAAFNPPRKIKGFKLSASNGTIDGMIMIKVTR